MDAHGIVAKVDNRYWFAPTLPSSNLDGFEFGEAGELSCVSDDIDLTSAAVGWFSIDHGHVTAAAGHSDASFDEIERLHLSIKHALCRPEGVFAL